MNPKGPKRIERRIFGVENEASPRGVVFHDGDSSIKKEEHEYRQSIREVLVPPEYAWRIPGQTNSSYFMPDQGKLGFQNQSVERSTPECIGAKNAALRETANLPILASLAVELRRRHPQRLGRISFHKTDRNCRLILDDSGKPICLSEEHPGSSHGNYLTLARVTIEDLEKLIAFFLTRFQIIGNGGIEVTPEGTCQYVCSQRARLIKTMQSPGSLNPVPLIGTKGFSEVEGWQTWAYADPMIWRRFHDPSENQNMSETQLFLKRIMVDLMLMLLEEKGFLVPPPRISDFRLASADEDEGLVATLNFFNTDIFGQHTVEIADGRSWSALDFQSYYISEVLRYVREGRGRLTKEREEGLNLWIEVVDKLKEKDIEWLARILDSAAILHYLFIPRLERAGIEPQLLLTPADHGIRIDQAITTKRGEETFLNYFLMLLVEYANVEVDHSPYGKMVKEDFVDRMFSAQEVAQASRECPTDTKAAYREELLSFFSKFKGEGVTIEAFNWDRVAIGIKSRIRDGIVTYSHKCDNPYRAKVKKLETNPHCGLLDIFEPS